MSIYKMRFKTSLMFERLSDNGNVHAEEGFAGYILTVWKRRP